jgi:hypothetical protein
MGSWRTDPGRTATSFKIEQDGAMIRLTRWIGEQFVAQFECDLGRECEFKDGKKKVNVSFAFRGPLLIETETRDKVVVKRSFGFSGPEEVLEVETTPVKPIGKIETMKLTRR